MKKKILRLSRIGAVVTLAPSALIPGIMKTFTDVDLATEEPCLIVRNNVSNEFYEAGGTSDNISGGWNWVKLDAATGLVDSYSKFENPAYDTDKPDNPAEFLPTNFDTAQDALNDYIING